jgi:hypothetical protein
MAAHPRHNRMLLEQVLQRPVVRIPATAQRFPAATKGNLQSAAEDPHCQASANRWPQSQLTAHTTQHQDALTAPDMAFSQSGTWSSFEQIQALTEAPNLIAGPGKHRMTIRPRTQ